MTREVAPWLQGLDEAWEIAADGQTSTNVSSASHDASPPRSNGSRGSRRRLSGLPSSSGSQKTRSNATTQIKRSPLAPLSNSNANTFRRQNGTTTIHGTRSVSDTSDGSLLQCGTVQQRSKSASPTKKQETLEWKKRLLNGQVSYVDQTDLFGPSGLENIFARSSGRENSKPTAKKQMSWLHTQKNDATMPSSPPPWPRNLTDCIQQERLQEVSEERSEQDEQYSQVQEHDSFRSHPFDSQDGFGAEEEPHVSDTYVGQDREKVGNRTISGQTELDHENFSPVFISKHTTVNGQVNYAALDSHLVKQFQTMRVNLRHPSQRAAQQETEEANDDACEAAESSTFSDGPQSDSMPAGPDFSLSENLPTGTPPVASLGRNVELKRGGYSTYGSFKQRPLSPSPLKVEESRPPEQSELLSPSAALSRPLRPAHTPPAIITPLRPTTPSPAKSRSSGSPLKLFGPHDTFTSNRLLRRMSQLEPEGALDQDEEDEQPEELMEFQAAVGSSKDYKVSQASREPFGSGHLDRHTFHAEITITSASDPELADSDKSPGSEIPPPGAKDPIKFRLEMSPEVVDTFKLKRKLSKRSVTRSSKASTLESQKPVSQLQPTIEDVLNLDAYYERAAQVKSFEGGKRPPTSPFKNPTPKRRRTLHASELLAEVAEANLSYHYEVQEAASSRKRKDARQGSAQIVADPDTLSNRKILRPRNPTPSQCSYARQQQIEAELREAAEEFAAQEPEKLEAVMEQIGSSVAGSDLPQTLQEQAEVLAKEVANFNMRVHKPSGEHSERKRSITTQDFMNEAIMVMQAIRAKQRPQSHLGSVEESDAEGSSLRPDSAVEDSGEALRVSRPPSRDGRHSGWRRAVRPQTDARVVSHLRKFQEGDDTEFIAESVASLHMDDDECQNENVVVVEDEVSNIRITGPPPEIKRADASSDESQPQTRGSQGSTLGTQQTNNTTCTNSTRKSENVGTLAPDAVAHLIGEQVCGMTFDKQQQRWVRMKSLEKKQSGFLEPPSNLTSDDDPFREISDLPVDEQTELRRISASSKTARPSSATERAASNHAQQPAESRTGSAETVISRPVTRDSSHLQSRIHHFHSSSVPSRYTALASSQQQEKVETRATSYSDEELAKISAMSKARREPLEYATAQATLALRNERNSLEDEPAEVATEMNFPSPPGHQISKPVVDMPQPSPAPRFLHSAQVRIVDRLRDDTVVDDEVPELNPISSVKMRQSPPKIVRPVWDDRPKQVSLRRQTLTRGHNGDVREQSDLSLVAALPGDRMMSLSMSVSRPVVTGHQSNRIAEMQSFPIEGDPNSTFLLSDLPDFTIHEDDGDRPSERALAKRLAKHAATEVNDRYALAVKDLVKTLTNVQQDEPYWEDIKQLDLRDQSLASLHGLDEFCSRVQDMDVSGNELAHLNGAPSSIRRLFARSNQLTSLTCWSHMRNLQYLDISGNELDSLAGLGRLIHLRELCADDNKVVSLDGIQEMDGLLKLRLRRNQIQYVSFEGFQLQRLVELDLSGNKVCAVEGLERLISLKSLRLDGNMLQAGLTLQQPMACLESLSVRVCGLESLRVDVMPNLRFLDADDNYLTDIEGIAALKKLECLSLRRQTLPPDTPICIFDHPVEARMVRLSCNIIPTLWLSTIFLNLQHLELASVGLQELPDDFGLRMPNLRSLNMNFNSLKDVRPLLNIQKLAHVSLCGNRLDRLRKSVATLAKLTTLRSVDLRENPFNRGFYAPALTCQTSIVRRRLPSDAADEDEDAEAMERARHVLPRGDAEQDRQHQSRIDQGAKLRRRVYELLLAHSCPALEDLDGLVFAKQVASARDRTWERLLELGVVRKSHGSSSPVLLECKTG